MGLTELKRGQTFMVENPVKRLVTVLKTGTFEKLVAGGVETQGEPKLVQVPCVYVKATVAAVKIDDIVSAKVAKQGHVIREAVRGADVDQELDSRLWKEVWCERMVGLPIKRAGMIAPTISESPNDQVPQVYCAVVTTMDDKRVTGKEPEVEKSPLRSSGMHGASVEPLVLIDPKAIHGDAFAVVTEEVAEEAEKVVA